MHAWQWSAHLLNATIKSIDCNKRNMIASWFYFVGIPGMLSQFLDSLSLVFPRLLWATVQASDFGSLSICQHVPKKAPWTQLQVLFWSSFNSLVASFCRIFLHHPVELWIVAAAAAACRSHQLSTQFRTRIGGQTFSPLSKDSTLRAPNTNRVWTFFVPHQPEIKV